MGRETRATDLSIDRADHGDRSKARGTTQEASEAVWQEELAALLRKLRRKPEELARSGKSADWKLAVASALKPRTTVTNRWLATTLHMGNLHEVSRKVGAWTRHPDPMLHQKLQGTPNPKALFLAICFWLEENER